ncbi:MAG: HAMP domain-containing sensor histidine kinase [Rikenellaceae bacterium]
MRFGYRARITFIIIGAVIASLSMFYTNYIARELANKEKQEIKLWTHAVSLKNRTDRRSMIESDVVLSITNSTTSIPAIMTDEYLRVHDFMNVDTKIVEDPVLLRKTLEEMTSEERQPIIIRGTNGHTYTVFYDDSALLQGLYFFPYIQLSIIVVLIIFGFISYSSSKSNEQNRVWVGLTKETAHQLGTPTSSLLGWIEFLRTQPIDSEYVDDMNKDVTRLMKVVDRFSKIGSVMPLKVHNIYDVVAATVDYYSTRLPRSVKLNYERFSLMPYQALLDISLFEWVIENLIKNAIDALGGKGEITVEISATQKWIRIDVSDTGKGISSRNQKRIFQAGFTTKTRGWGLGLSLSKRIVEAYHRGKIYVLRSEIDRGTTMRVALKRY